MASTTTRLSIEDLERRDSHFDSCEVYTGDSSCIFVLLFQSRIATFFLGMLGHRERIASQRATKNLNEITRSIYYTKRHLRSFRTITSFSPSSGHVAYVKHLNTLQLACSDVTRPRTQDV